MRVSTFEVVTPILWTRSRFSATLRNVRLAPQHIDRAAGLVAVGPSRWRTMDLPLSPVSAYPSSSLCSARWSERLSMLLSVPLSKMTRSRASRSP